ncbi:MAG TPA: hypothetical protein VFC90_12020 [Planctomycetota bacterium]|nr:hypothetical protein [Planctomycetota bacterium]
MKDPDPAGGPSTDPQEPPQHQEGNSTIGALDSVSSTVLQSLDSPTLYISAIRQMGVSWKIDGSFSVDGTLSNSESCCVTGKPDSIAFEDATGISLGITWSRFDIALIAYQQVEGRSKTQVTNCNSSMPDFIEDASIDITMEWQFTLLGRFSIFEMNLGVVGCQLGVEAGGSASKVEFGEGRSNSATFELDETMNTVGAYVGSFVGLNAKVGGIQGRAVASLSLGSIGDGYSAERMYSLSLGLGVEF